ncbi:hypothetical protein CR513_10903, partial [Mucuna pruriens]
MVTTFVDTLPSPFYDKAVGSVTSSFADLVTIGERIKCGIKRGKFAQVNSGVGFAKKANHKKNKGEARIVLIDPSNPYGQSKSPYTAQIILNKPRTSASTDSLTQPKTEAASTSNMQGTQLAQQSRRGRVLASIPMTYTTLFPHPTPKEHDRKPPYPKSYDPNAKCDYHARAIRHSTEKCWGFKHKIQDLIDEGWLGFKENEPNVNNNPLHAHGGQSINTLSHNSLNQVSDETGGNPSITDANFTPLPTQIHRNLLLKILNEAHVAQDIIVERFGGIMNNLMISSHLFFSEEEIPAKGRRHNQPLHILVKCGDYMIARVLIDNGSSLNVLPKITLDKLCSTNAQLRANSIIVRAFNGSKREVMDIRPAYSCLLGRPWTHSVGVVPSFLHQRVTFVSGKQLISIMGEKELMVSTPLLVGYIEEDEEALETYF